MRQPTRIYVDREALERNMREDTTVWPTICVRHANGRTTRTNQVAIDGPSTVCYSPEGLPDGARVWIETSAPVRAL